MVCVLCYGEVTTTTTWRNIIRPERPKRLCGDCDALLIRINDGVCTKCSKDSTSSICADCLAWKRDSEVFLVRNQSVFAYNEQMQEIIAKWKYSGDYIIGKAFEADFIKVFQDTFSFLEKDAICIPIPLSTERLSERGFNQAEQLADFLPLKSVHLLSRMHSEKQANKTRTERLKSDNPFILTNSVYKQVVLVDDIYTTGVTLRHAASLLKTNPDHEIYAFTLIRS